MIRIAILDDYQGVALQMADWSQLQERAEILVFRDCLSDPKALVERLKPFQVLSLMRERTPLPRSILQELPNLRFISSPGRNNPSIDLQAAKELGIVTSYTHSVMHGPLELTWALILALVRHIPIEWDAMRKGGWQRTVGGDLRGKTLGILGLGKIGSKVAKIGSAFDMKVIAWSQNLTPEKAKEEGVTWVPKSELFSRSDFLTLHLVLSERTRGIVGREEMASMKPSSYLINTARGPLIDEQALIEALKKGKIGGAALDVYETEPLPPQHPFRFLPNVIATPHIGFVTKEAYQIFYRETVENITAWLEGTPIRTLSG